MKNYIGIQLLILIIFIVLLIEYFTLEANRHDFGMLVYFFFMLKKEKKEKGKIRE